MTNPNPSMRYSIYAGVLISLAWLPAAQAQQRAKVQIDDIHVGFNATPDPGGPNEFVGPTRLSKAGCWTPVYVWLRAGPEGLPGKGEVVVETADTDDIQNTYTVPLPTAGLAPEEMHTALAYMKCGGTGGEVKIRVRSGEKTVMDMQRTYEAQGPADTVFLVVGGRLPGLRRTFAKENQANQTSPMEPANRVAHVDDAVLLPTRWFGYGSCDLMLLVTGNRKFVTDLMHDDKGRPEALAEWVRRGGRLVITCGRNQDVIPQLFSRLQIPLAVDAPEPLDVPSVEGLEAWSGQGPLQAKPGAKITLAKLEPRHGLEVERLLPRRTDDRSPLLLVRWPYGLGQVTLVAFDLDQPAFTDWPGQGEFWQQLMRQAGFERSKLPPNPNNYVPPGGYGGRGPNDTSDLAGKLQANLEEFKDVSVISFGWVALFILIYIIIVGPLDYFFLKKVVKRLELTWITFPTVVIVVSAGAYFTAYALKGNDLKINKVDVVDIDLPNQHAYGTTWFTLFSPRIQLYTVGVEPAAPVWANEGSPSPAASVVVSWQGRPDTGYGGFGRTRSQSLFHRTYEFAPDATGLTGVPIQVWSTKSFTATWERAFRPGRAVPQLSRKPDGGLAGTLANPLPVALEDAVLIHGEGGEGQVKVYVLGTLAPEQQKPLVVNPTTFSQWQTTSAGAMSSNNALVRQLMFYDALSSHEGRRDNALHYLDQSWRKSLPKEAMLVGRVARREGPAEEVTTNEASPSRLWLGQLPSSGEKRPALAGTLTQDTYVRVLLHVAPPPKG